MTQDAREQARHISEVTKAFAEGKEIQFKGKNEDDRGWMTVPDPTWQNEFYDYRVKPEERKPREFWIVDEYCYTSEQLKTMPGGERVPWPGQIHVREILPETETESD